MIDDELKAMEKFIDIGAEFIVKYGFQVIAAIIIIVIGLLVARWLANLVISVCTKRNLDITLTRFLGSVVKMVVLAFVMIIALGKFGITIAPFIAAVGAVAFGSSLALQGPMSNYGAGLVIVVTRPFVVGNTITVKGVSGIVEEVGLAATHLSTEDGEEITIPNKHIVGEILTNSFANKIVETKIGISYEDEPEKAIEVIREVLAQTPGIVTEPDPHVGIEEFGDSSVNIGMRYWVPTKQYYQTLYEANSSVYAALKEKQINIPFPQRDVHIISKQQALE
jgi:small conductance mechanosensitive channel